MESTRAASLAMVGSATSVAVGAAIGATVFPIVGPAGVVALRQAVAAIATLAVARPRLRAIGWRRLRPAVLLGAVLVVMNLSLYASISRVGLGLAVTLEFLGPLAVALVGSRRRLDLACALGAGLGVVLLTGTVAGLDPLGIAFGFVAAGAWAAYIVIGQRAALALPGLTATAVSNTTAAAATSPLLVLALIGLDPAELPRVLLVGVAVGLLCSALPYAIDMWALRRVSRARFGVLQSLHPAAATLFGFLILGQTLTGWQLAGIALVMLSNVVATARPADASGPPDAASPRPGSRRLRLGSGA
ncbi:DMT family transporter [Agromyces sp. NPDC127015]|uniref:EamA family transporter n=1 Tax=Agromyces sp. NPDC127015 TaxID=3347108 RepID=UPI00365A5D10